MIHRRAHYDVIVMRLKAYSQAVPVHRTDMYCSSVHFTYLSQAKSKILFIQNVNISYNLLTHCGLVTPYGVIDLGQQWFR